MPRSSSGEFHAVLRPCVAVKTPRDPNLTVFFGAYIDVLSRTPFVAAGIYKQKNDYLITFRMPCGREGYVDCRRPRDRRPSA